jgi:hypothetical protein
MAEPPLSDDAKRGVSVYPGDGDMKRDHVLLREILHRLERQPAGSCLPVEAVPTHERDTVIEHMRMLDQMGLAHGVFTELAGNPAMAELQGLTPAGRDYLEAPPEGVRAKDIERTTRRLDGIATDIAGAERDPWNGRVKALVHFLRTDLAARPAVAAVQAIDIDAVEWFNNAAGRSRGGFHSSGPVEFPPEAEYQASLALRLLSAVADGELDSVKLITQLYGPQRPFRESLGRLNMDLVVPLLREVGWRLSEWHEVAVRAESPAVGTTGTVSIYYLQGNNSRVTTGTDASHNVVQLNEAQLFSELRRVVEASLHSEEDRRAVVERIDAMERANGTPSFSERYLRFMGAVADHAQVLGPVIAPFIPALGALAAR